MTTTKKSETFKTFEEVKKMLPLEARCIQSIQDFKAPRTTQDRLDVAAAEFATANYLRQQADKRYDIAKSVIVGMTNDEVELLREQAIKTMTKSTISMAGEDWCISLACNKPATKVDAYDLRTELIKQGISVDVIDEAIVKVTKKSTPALVITATRLVE
jgi:hypothetical protein